MLRDLLKTEPVQGRLEADVVVVGAGLAGLVLATRLARSNLRVVMLESGAETQETDCHPLNEVVQIGQTHRGATNGRYRCLGGTSTRWGGAMLPFLRCDMEPHTAGWDIQWPISFDHLTGYFAEIEHLFCLPKGPFEVCNASGGDTATQSFFLRSAKWPAFKNRNAAEIFAAEIRGDKLEIWLNATASQFRLDENGRLAEIIAVSPSGIKVTVAGRIFALAAGSIECTRLLLQLDAEHGDRIFAPDNVLGRYLHDHLSSTAADIVPCDGTALARALGVRFEGPGMRDRRLSPSGHLRAVRRLPGAFSHIVAVSEGANSYAALRSIYQGLQRRSLPKLHDVTMLSRDLGWFSQAIWWRFVKKQLLAPRGAAFELVLVIEQMPHHANRISLSMQQCDRNGTPLAQIDWHVRDPDIAAFRTFQSTFSASLV